MTNKEYFAALDPLLNEMKQLKKDAMNLAAGILGKSLTEDDFFFVASADKCIRLTDGMISMLPDRNLTCAGGLLRMQLDVCMRTYAAYIAEDPQAVVRTALTGDPIKKLKDKNGEKMTDYYLKEEINKLDPTFTEVYQNACGYIHLSEKAFFQTVISCENDQLALGIGSPLPDKRNDPLLECAYAHIYFTELLFKMLQPVADSKKRLDSSHTENNQES